MYLFKKGAKQRDRTRGNRYKAKLKAKNGKRRQSVKR